MSVGDISRRQAKTGEICDKFHFDVIRFPMGWKIGYGINIYITTLVLIQ